MEDDTGAVTLQYVLMLGVSLPAAILLARQVGEMVMHALVFQQLMILLPI